MADIDIPGVVVVVRTSFRLVLPFPLNGLTSTPNWSCLPSMIYWPELTIKPRTPAHNVYETNDVSHIDEQPFEFFKNRLQQCI